MSRKVFSWMLTLALVLTVLPVGVLAADAIAPTGNRAFDALANLAVTEGAWDGNGGYAVGYFVAEDTEDVVVLDYVPGKFLALSYQGTDDKGVAYEAIVVIPETLAQPYEGYFYYGEPAEDNYPDGYRVNPDRVHQQYGGDMLYHHSGLGEVVAEETYGSAVDHALRVANLLLQDSGTNMGALGFDWFSQAPDVPVYEVGLYPESLEIEVGETAELALWLYPDTSQVQLYYANEVNFDEIDDRTNFVFIGSNDPSVVTVDKHGKVTAVGMGTAHIYLETNERSAICNVTVLDPDAGCVVEDGVLVEYTGTGGRVNIPDDVTAIGAQAFYLCQNLTEVRIPDGVTSIGAEAFSFCKRLSAINLPDSVTDIGESAFWGCTALEQVNIPEHVTVIKPHTFSMCENLRQVTIPPCVTSIGDYAFESCGFRNVTIPGTVQTIGDGAFYGCAGLNSVTVEKGVTSVGANAFYACGNLTDAVIPDSVRTIGGDAFADDWNLTITGYDNTAAQEYAEAYDIPFVSLGAATTLPFFDVSADAYYYGAVDWAVAKGITNGISATSFGPDQNCTRGQIVTFLWRAKGSPEPTTTENPFLDVKESDYFYKAVLWAVEKGITNGLTATTFGPDRSCTRGQAVTFLWRAESEPVPESERNPFTDVTSGAYYEHAVLWALEHHITNGLTDTTFGPDNSCTRAQIVTFLYRDLT